MPGLCGFPHGITCLMCENSHTCSAVLTQVPRYVSLNRLT
ncbi:hypothetical protein Salmuc_04715 [Salipiger mucosus DSM 16094]|uniref:Uncharacterized protein n=1 Tax=Salipiger mucosus DSM 16094 TaxID=1123237 RepID=S9RBN5_9RHOB|nr:hypothetical protein Salmuc_04715 [Salipiger mucosus DSM 16094]